MQPRCGQASCPHVAAAQLIALMDGLQIQWLLDPATDMAAALRAHVDRLLRLTRLAA